MPQISVVQIINETKNSEKLDFQKIIQQNMDFLTPHGVEYVVFDQLPDLRVVEFIKKFPNLKYFRKNFTNLKNTFMESLLLGSGEQFVFLNNEDVLNSKNLEEIEKIRPKISRIDFKKLANIKKDNFKFDDFNLLIKDKKTFWEKIMTLFI